MLRTKNISVIEKAKAFIAVVLFVATLLFSALAGESDQTDKNDRTAHNTSSWKIKL